MEVMATVRAILRPMPPPRARPPMMIAQFQRPTLPCATKTTSATTAMIIPAAESRLPVRAVAGEFIRWRPITKSAAPTMNDSWTR